MASITFAADSELKSEMENFLWVNWSELVREKLIEEERAAKDFKLFKKIIAKSKLTEEDALKLGREINKSLHKRYKKIYKELS